MAGEDLAPRNDDAAARTRRLRIAFKSRERTVASIAPDAVASFLQDFAHQTLAVLLF
jgi:hypothetical protein